MGNGFTVTIDWGSAHEIINPYPPEPAEVRVARGAALLDRHKPGWWRRINMGVFDVRSCRTCAVGQAFGDYDTGVSEMGIPGQVFAHGFAAYSDVDYNRLNTAWANLVHARRAAYPVDAPPAVWVHRSHEVKELVQA